MKQHKFEILSVAGKHIDYMWSRHMLKLRNVGDSRIESKMYFETIMLKRLS